MAQEHGMAQIIRPAQQAKHKRTWRTKMSVVATDTVASLRVVAISQALKVDGTDPKYGDWRDDLVRDGFAVIKGAIPREMADKYADAMYSWLEGLYVSIQTCGGMRNDANSFEQ